MKKMILTSMVIFATLSSFAFEEMDFENKGSAAATYILNNSAQPVGLAIEGDAAKTVYLKLAVKESCLAEDATAGSCRKQGSAIACMKNINVRGAFYKCALVIDPQGAARPLEM